MNERIHTYYTVRYRLWLSHSCYAPPGDSNPARSPRRTRQAAAFCNRHGVLSPLFCPPHLSKMPDEGAIAFEVAAKILPRDLKVTHTRRPTATHTSVSYQDAIAVERLAALEECISKTERTYLIYPERQPQQVALWPLPLQLPTFIQLLTSCN